MLLNPLPHIHIKPYRVKLIKMGNLIQHKTEPKCKAVMVGLDAAGKTTIIYACKSMYEEIETTIPTIGFNVETVNILSTNCTVWDVGGEDKIRHLWRHYYQNIDAIIWVQDCNDRYRIEEAKEELSKILDEDLLSGYPLLVFANKQDIPGAFDAEELTKQLDLHLLNGKRPWQVFNSIATQKQGLAEGFKWLVKVAEEPESYIPQYEHIAYKTKSANKI